MWRHVRDGHKATNDSQGAPRGEAGMEWRGVTLLRRDVHALEALRVDRFLHHGGPFCFIDECRECSLRLFRAALRKRGRHANHRKRARNDLCARQGVSGRISDARVRPKDVCLAGAQQFGCVTHDGRAQRDTDDLTTPERPEGTEYSEVPPEEAR
jgi:hypothetical protein